MDFLKQFAETKAHTHEHKIFLLRCRSCTA